MRKNAHTLQRLKHRMMAYMHVKVTQLFALTDYSTK